MGKRERGEWGEGERRGEGDGREGLRERLERVRGEGEKEG